MVLKPPERFLPPAGDPEDPEDSASGVVVDSVT